MNCLYPINALVHGGADINVRKVNEPYYRDYAGEKEDLTCSSMSPSSRCIAPQAFPSKLHYMLQEVEKDGIDSVISWMVHGRSFLVKDQGRFVKEILPL
jgi:hypothetical protein